MYLISSNHEYRYVLVGKSFAATVSKDLSKTPMLFPITLKT